tara:strand:+ start:4733 stop:5758 length:1026 start_codon:yes stop_codon:yes gene_type:complete
MIKIKILNQKKGRNEPTFRPLSFVKDLLHDYSIDITESDDYDFLFIGMEDFIDKKRSLEESIEWGLENLSKIAGDYFLFDGSDSHSLMGAYEVFEKSNAIYLFKQQLHRDKNKYKIPKAFNKWFFGDGSDLDLSYDISDDTWKRIKLTNWNFLSHVPSHKNFIDVNKNKSIDLCAIFSSEMDENKDHGVRNDIMYKNHREKINREVKKLEKEFNVVTGRRDFQEYMKILYDSKLYISPFGMGEIRQGDGEAMQVGTVVVKEDMSSYDFGANTWRENETYIPFDYDCSNLADQVRMALDNYKKYEQLIFNMREKYLKEYDNNKLCLHWYNIFNNLDTVVEAE